MNGLAVENVDPPEQLDVVMVVLVESGLQTFMVVVVPSRDELDHGWPDDRCIPCPSSAGRTARPVLGQRTVEARKALGAVERDAVGDVRVGARSRHSSHCRPCSPREHSRR